MLSISASEGRRDYSLTPKSPQMAHLYMTYEATYTLWRLFFKLLTKSLNAMHRRKSPNNNPINIPTWIGLSDFLNKSIETEWP